MSACTRCGFGQAQELFETTGQGHSVESVQFAYACGEGGAPSQLMALSEAAKAMAHDARARARLSSIGVLTVLVITCALSLFSLYHPGSKQGPILVFSKLSNQAAQPPAN